MDGRVRMQDTFGRCARTTESSLLTADSSSSTLDALRISRVLCRMEVLSSSLAFSDRSSSRRPSNSSTFPVSSVNLVF